MPTTSSTTSVEPPPPVILSSVDHVTVADVVARYRLRLPEPRLHRVAPRFDHTEWRAIARATEVCEKKRGGFVAAAAVAASRADRRTDHATERHRLDQLMDGNIAAARIGGSFNRLVHRLNSGGLLSDHTDGVLQSVAHAVAQVDTAVTLLGATVTADIHTAVDIGAYHRQRSQGPREHRVSPRFSDREWTGILTAAQRFGVEPGAYVATTALLAARSDNPRAVIADTRAQLEELMEANRLLAALANNTTQLLHHLNTDDTPHGTARRLLHTLGDVLDRIDATARVIAREGHEHP
ncbi:hypothetical protein [Streptomyces sp. SID13588]|uniref:hypothetical protein n=1 Tax=Streptomyces sp. SID13588 TaxID=2706051 RepID=UPI0013C6651F|nr:hypothetical protein [Streptomyces sp. SID13588]NEA73211.1 hypothetical protein [Streptomyces sp. SID13588]